MITYSQSSTEQRLDAAIDGKTVSQDDPAFARMRERSAAINAPHLSVFKGATRINVGQGLLRIEMPGNESDAHNHADIVLVLELAELHKPIDALLSDVVRSVTAIGRSIDSVQLEEAVAAAADLDNSRRRRSVLRVGAVIAAVVVIGLVFAVVATVMDQR